MEWNDIEKYKNGSNYGLRERATHEVIIDAVYERIDGYDFMGQSGAFILTYDYSHNYSQRIYDVFNNSLSKEFSRVVVLYPYYVAIREEETEKYLLYGLDSLLFVSLGYAEKNGDFLTIHEGEKVGIGVIGFPGGDQFDNTNNSEEYNLDRIVLFPDYDEISLSYDEYPVSAIIKTKKNGLVELYRFEAEYPHYRVSRMVNGAYELIRYGEHYISCFKDGLWDMYVKGNPNPISRSDNISEFFRDPYLLKANRILIGRNLEKEWWCDSISEFVEEYHPEVGKYVHYSAFCIDDRCGVWDYYKKEPLLNNLYREVVPVFREKWPGCREISHFIISGIDGKKGLYEIERKCFVISCEYSSIIPVFCPTRFNQGNEEHNIIVGFIVYKDVSKSIGVLGLNGEVICPLNYYRCRVDSEIIKRSVFVTKSDSYWNGTYLGKTEHIYYRLCNDEGVFIFDEFGRKKFDQAYDEITIFQPEGSTQKGKDAVYYIIKQGSRYGLIYEKYSQKQVCEVDYDYIKPLDDLNSFLLVKNGELRLIRFDEIAV